MDREPDSGLRRAVTCAESEAVAEGLRRCSERFRNRIWLDPESPLLDQPGQFLRTATRDDLAKNRDHLADYAAASSLLHCSDAWSILGNATQCLLAGNLSQAIHLVYYSEFRSALSLMNSTGVIVANDGAASVSTDAVFGIRPGSSHQLLWQVFAEWCGSAETQALVGETMTFHKVPMTRWASIAAKGGTGAPVVAELLRRWGVDLQNLGSDRDARNLASYNPSHLYEDAGADYGSWAKATAASTTAYLEPDSRAGFPAVDNALFLTVLTSTVGDSQDQLRRVLRAVYNSNFEAERVLNLIVTQRSAGPSLIDKATQLASTAGITLSTVESMLGRALILGRLATGLASNLQRRAGVDRDRFSWWSTDLAVRQGFWLATDRPDKLEDMWADLETGLDDLDSVNFAQPSGTFEIHDSASYGMVTATGLARVAVWSLSA